MKPRILTWVGIKMLMGENRNACRILIENPERAKPVMRPRHIEQNRIKVAQDSSQPWTSTLHSPVHRNPHIQYSKKPLLIASKLRLEPLLR
jgi:hypothetical protein